MIILHAGYLAGELILWGEKPVEPGGVVRARRGRQPRVPKPLPSPYDAGASAVSEALREAAGLKLGPTQSAMPTVVWLPTVAGKPAANDALIAERPDPEAPVSLAPWVVSGLALAPQQWVDLLCRCSDQHTLAPGVIIGYDLRYWATVMRFAGALVARQQFLPGLTEQDGGYRACWEPLITGPEVERLSQLARAMPPACRALAKERAPAPQAAAREVLESGVSYLLDPLVRRAAQTTPQHTPLPLKKRPPSTEVLHDRWLGALSSADGIVSGNPRELAEFADQVRAWRQPLAATAAAPFRLCFRLEDPGVCDSESGLVMDLPKTGASWRVSYLLQAVADPSLLVPAGDAWNERKQAAFQAADRAFNPREHLLLSLGQAAGLGPRIEDSLRVPAPTGYPTDEVGAYEFLSNTAAALEQAGFGVLLPAAFALGRLPEVPEVQAFGGGRRHQGSCPARIIRQKLVGQTMASGLGELRSGRASDARQALRARRAGVER